MGALGETGDFVLFDSIAPLPPARRPPARPGSTGRATGTASATWKGGFPLVVIAVAGILLALAISFVMSAASVNDPDDGTCDYDLCARDRRLPGCGTTAR